MGCRGILAGGTAGRTTLAGEGLQHQDGHSHLLAYAHPHVVAYDPAFAYELAVILQEAIRRLGAEQENLCYYLTVGNEPYAMPPMPDGARDGILKGMYRFRSTPKPDAAAIKLLGSGAIMNEVLKAQDLLAGDYGVESEAWAVTSYQQLHRDGLDVERWNRLHPHEEPATAYARQCLGGDDKTLVVAASDYTKALPLSIRHWAPARFVALGTDGFGLSEGRAALREYFEVDARHVAYATLEALSRQEAISAEQLREAARKLEIDPDKADPAAL
jgi:pyruvate dehydrogenase E1 component